MLVPAGPECADRSVRPQTRVFGPDGQKAFVLNQWGTVGLLLEYANSPSPLQGASIVSPHKILVATTGLELIGKVGTLIAFSWIL